eukprot:gnl/Chilomastix_caulleri/1817.p1 GENE.gnl/Chilomastix_caulleri/1817~~gnl/Chilomastix_caulleri/1817.p1  ORF type:complete len:142 (+),score=36.10 gnl/Chilomastix_caulleri/1817:132-557(+)
MAASKELTMGAAVCVNQHFRTSADRVVVSLSASRDKQDETMASGDESGLDLKPFKSLSCQACILYRLKSARACNQNGDDIETEAVCEPKAGMVTALSLIEQVTKDLSSVCRHEEEDIKKVIDELVTKGDIERSGEYLLYAE